MLRRFLILLTHFTLSACAADEFDDLLRWLPGHYDTFAHAEAGEARQSSYRHVKAELRIVRLADGAAGFPAGKPVFYLEQALAGQTDKPYRQRLLVFERTAPGTATLWDFRITDPEDLVGAPLDKLNAINPVRLIREAGCEVVWVRVDRELYKGSAGASRSCKSQLREATHVISYSELTPQTLISLDQGFDDAGAHKWGPPPGVIGHIFRKRPPR